MKPFRITVVLLALMVLPLFVTQALAATFVADTVYVPKSLVGANTVHKPVIGFTIPGEAGQILDKITIKSYIDSYNATKMVELYRENHANAGFQYGEDVRIAWRNTSGGAFDIMKTIDLSPNYTLNNTTLDTFYITLDINTPVVQADPLLYDGTCLEIVMEQGKIHLKNGDTNSNHVHNIGWLDASESPYFDPYKLCFDCLGPHFDLHLCFETANTCSIYTYYGTGWSRLLNIDQEDSLRICATDVEGDIDTAEGIHIIGKVYLLPNAVESKYMFGVDDLMLTCPDVGSGGCGEMCDSCWTTAFKIPDEENDGGFDGVDADSGHWAICAWAKDTVDNIDTICLEHDALPYRIDTQKPKLDSVTWQLTYDGNGDGKIGLGDCIMVIGWGLSNSWEPVFECSKMEVDWSWYTGNPSPDWIQLDDVLEHNRIFRHVFCLTNPVAIDSTNCPVNFLVRAEDNACNYDTLTGEICGTIDLDPPSLEVLYEGDTDYDTMWTCMSLGDKVLIRALVGGSDIASVTAMLDSAGIDKDMHHALLLPHRGGGLYSSGGQYDTIWTITEPPILYGKDADNSTPPPTDNDYTVTVIACDDVGNCDTVSDDLNYTLDTRRPRPIGFNCPDTVPCIHAQSLAGGLIDLYWDMDCDENDAYYYYVWASFNGAEFESIGATNIIEQTDPNFVFWHSEPLEAGYWRFKIKTEDNCSNVGDFSCVVGALADSTPPNACIVFPDSGGTYGAPFMVKARSEDQDIGLVCLWYRLRPDLEGLGSPGPWLPCDPKLCMNRPGMGLVFLDTMDCVPGDYVGWVELLPLSCDVIGNCQDTTRAYAEACIDDEMQNLVPGHFLFYWDTTRAVVTVESVNGFPSPQTVCGFDVYPDSVNKVVINVVGATPADLFTIDVRALADQEDNRIDYRNHVTMPCTVDVYVENWPVGTQDLYVYLTDEGNGKDCVPYPLIVELCVPPQTAPCIEIVLPREWMRIPCSKTDLTCVPIRADIIPGCPDTCITQVKFFYSVNAPGPPWNFIDEVFGSFEDELPSGSPRLNTDFPSLAAKSPDNTGPSQAPMPAGMQTFSVTCPPGAMIEGEPTCYNGYVDNYNGGCNSTPSVFQNINLDTTICGTSGVFDDYYTRDTDWFRLVLTQPDQITFWAVGEFPMLIFMIDGGSENCLDYTILDAATAATGDTAVISMSLLAGVYWLWVGPSDWGSYPCGVKYVAGVESGSGCRTPNYWETCWNNEGLIQDGDTVYFMAVAYNQYHVPDTSELVKVFADCQAPQVKLIIEDTVHTCHGAKVSGEITMKAEIIDTMVDVTYIGFYYKLHSDPDIRDYWHWMCEGEPAWYENIYMCTYNTDSLSNNTWYDIRIKVVDQAGNVWQDMDEDGQFDDSTFNWAVASGAGVTVFVDNEAPQPAISMVADPAASIYNVNPSEWLGGKDRAYVKAGDDITAEISVLPSGDTCEVMKVEWFLDVCAVHDSCWRHVGTSTDPYHFPVTFNPVTDGLIPAWELEDGFWYGHLKAVLYDSLGNSKEDEIGLYILDVTPTQAVIINPLNDSYVSGDVTLTSLALNSYEIAKVCYEYRADGETEWYPLNGGYPNACVYQDCDTSGPVGKTVVDTAAFTLVWHTLNTIPDGAYYLRAVATDCSNNMDENPHTIKVTVNNTPPTVVIDDPRICERTCPDDTVDTLGYVGRTVTLYATVSSTIKVNRVEFYYKNIFGYPDTWTLIDTADYFTTLGKYSMEWTTPSDGRYHIKAVAYDASGKSGESEWIVISVDNSPPFSQIISVMGQPVPPTSIDITKGDVIDIELVAIDSTSDEGWTRCYNSGLKSISVCIENCKRGEEITKCFEVTPVEDGIDTVKWNTSGLEFHGCDGCYYLYVIATDCLGNVDTSDQVTVYVYDIVAPVTTIGGFDENYIYGYSTQKIETLLFEYAPKGTTDWIPIGWSSYVREHCDLHMYKTSWDPTSLADGDYWVRVISHDKCSNQNDSLAPVATISVAGGVITPYNPDVLGAMTFEKNWCVGGMHGLVRQTCSAGTPVIIARYNSHRDKFECVEMQHPQDPNDNEYAGSFNAEEIDDGGPAKFFSSVTVASEQAGPAYLTYLTSGSFDVVQVKRDLGTHGTYQDGCVEVTIPEGAVGDANTYDRYIWVAPTMMPWAPVTQPDLKPIGDNDGFATYVSFTDCYYCCGWWSSHYGGGDQGNLLKSPAEGDGDCRFNPGRWAKIKMCYDTLVTTDKAHLAVMWWDCTCGEFKSDDIFYPAGVEGFNTANHTVEFATTRLSGPFAVVELLERPCDGSIVVSLREQDIEPLCNGYTSPMPRFRALITDNFYGPSGIDQSSIKFKLKKPGQPYITIYDRGAGSDSCDWWAKGYGQYNCSGWDPVSGILGVGWNDSTKFWSKYYSYDPPGLCPGCGLHHFENYMNYFNCPPAPPLPEGDYFALVTAQNKNIQTCTDTVNFMVDATKPWMAFADSIGAYVGKNPHICIYFNDAKSGVDRSSIWVDLFGDDTSDPDPNGHSYIATIHPDQLDWVNDTTVCFDFTFEDYVGGYLHLYVYGGPPWKCYDECPNTQYYGYLGGVADCVGNRLGPFWRYYTVDPYGPTITNAYTSICDTSLKFEITDNMAGVLEVKVYEDSSLVDAIEQDEHNPNVWWYTPTEGAKLVTIEAIDKLGNHSYKDLTLKADCLEPQVRFDDKYVCLNPTIRFWVTDPNGVDWNSVNVYISGCSEACFFYAQDLKPLIDTETGLVTLDGCHLDCTDGQRIDVYVFSGTNYTGYGPKDLQGNYGQYRYCTFVVDAYAPSISVGTTTDRPIRITITDTKAGVDWSTLEFYEDSVLLDEEVLVIDQETGLIEYTPSKGGVRVNIKVKDKTGCNVATYTFKVPSALDEVISFGQPHNSPNPFDPREEVTSIYPDLTKDAYVTIKIYDFAGEFVKELCKEEWMGVGSYKVWDGRTDSGTEAGNGTYLCFIHAKDTRGDPKTAVVKITVLKKDK